ncbi:UPF0764 protein C16orf89 homolog [Clytia hemisphaerica]|uniref:Uncharacterized protein n=1 Tax=Clytia hemisphaerica TaxID=252671 RepID=A0A7M5X946_9CNID|eukprot:TCONS_00025502-protein
MKSRLWPVDLVFLVFFIQIFGDGLLTYQDENLIGNDVIKPRICSGFSDNEHKSKYISEIVASLDRIINHFSFYTDHLIADGLFGLRIAEGVLKNIVQYGDRYKHHKIEALHSRLSMINQLSYEGITKRKLPYDVQFDKIMREPFDRLWPFKSFKDFKKDIVKDYIHGIDKDFDEDFSDHCFALLFGTAPQSKGRQCVVTRKCIEANTREKTGDYMLTHQFLYFVFGFQYNCDQQIAKAMGGKHKMDAFFRKMAVNIAYQLQISGSPKDALLLDRELEQAMFCAMFGIVECTSRDLTLDFIKYVEADGCTKLSKDRKTREKRQDQFLGGCSQHTDGLMAAFLSLSLRSALMLPNCS